MFFGGGRKPEYPERTQAYTGRTCRLHTAKALRRDSNQEPVKPPNLHAVPHLNTTPKIQLLH